MELLPFAYHLRLLTPIFLGWLAWVVARAPYQERANRVLAAFLAVIAAGFTLEFFWDFFRGEVVPAHQAVRVGQNLLGIVDPPLLLLYALIFPRPRRLARSPVFWTAYGLAAVALAVATGLVQNLSDEPTLALVHVVYVNGTYLVAFGLLLTSYAREDRRYLSRQLGFLSLGVGFAALSRSGALFAYGGPFVQERTLQILYGSLVALGLLALVLAATWRAAAPRRRAVLRTGLWLVGLLAAFDAFWALAYFADRWMHVSVGLFNFYYSYRWIFFAGIVGYGILRFQLFDFELRMRQAVTLLLSAPIAVLGAMIAGSLAFGQGWTLLAARTIAFIVLVSLALPAFVLVNRTARIFLRDTPPQLARRRLEIYEATLEYALQRKEWTEEERRFVETLREVFDVSPREHEQVVERVRRPQGEPEHS